MTKKLLLLFVSTLLTLSAAEVALRTVGYHPLKKLDQGRGLILRPSDVAEMRYELTPGSSGRAWDTDVQINSAGFRGPEPPDDDDPRDRVVVLGDSITFGNLLPAGEAFPDQLGRLLNADGSNWITLNLGVGGYDTLQEAALLEHRALRYKPKLVVLAFCLNDAGFASPNLEYVVLAERYLNNPVMAHSRLAQFIMTNLDRLRATKVFEDQNKLSVFRRTNEGYIDPIGESETELREMMASAGDLFPSNWFRDEERIGRTRHAFNWIARLSEEHGFSVLVTIIPWLEMVDGGYPHATAHRIVSHEATRVGFDVIDMTEPFAKYGMEKLQVTEWDHCHPDVPGHRMMAEVLHNYITNLPASESIAESETRSTAIIPITSEGVGDQTVNR